MSELLLNHIEKDLNTKVNPRYLVEYDRTSDTKKVAGVKDLPYLRQSFNLFNKMEIIRDLKISLCRVDDRNVHEGLNLGPFGGLGGGAGGIGGPSGGIAEGHFEKMEY